MNTLSQYSTCFELFYFEDGKGDWLSYWAFPQENIIREYHNGHHTHNDSPYLKELPKFPEV